MENKKNPVVQSVVIQPNIAQVLKNPYVAWRGKHCAEKLVVRGLVMLPGPDAVKSNAHHVMHRLKISHRKLPSVRMENLLQLRQLVKMGNCVVVRRTLSV